MLCRPVEEEVLIGFKVITRYNGALLRSQMLIVGTRDGYLFDPPTCQEMSLGSALTNFTMAKSMMHRSPSSQPHTSPFHCWFREHSTSPLLQGKVRASEQTSDRLTERKWAEETWILGIKSTIIAHNTLGIPLKLYTFIY